MNDLYNSTKFNVNFYFLEDEEGGGKDMKKLLFFTFVIMVLIGAGKTFAYTVPEGKERLLRKSLMTMESITMNFIILSRFQKLMVKKLALFTGLH